MRDKLGLIAHETSLQRDIPVAAGAIDHSSMVISGNDDEVNPVPQTGSQIGLCLAPRDFNDCYTPDINKWSSEFMDKNSTYGFLKTRSPALVMHEEVVLSLAAFVDDVTKTHVWLGTPTPVEATVKINAASEMLEREPGDGGWHLNAGRPNHLLSLQGTGAKATTWKLQTKQSNMRMFGPYLASDGARSHDL
ncbi:unnamed protein product [Prorocentrum cordatum]|uniref:Phospholipase B-like n=1 Tax=Prorocentrum cordatum TaxID=2364126 RepID=A0ABN9QBV9_9DINO|nr:unnamed protein product [Polarella glacialis]